MNLTNNYDKCPFIQASDNSNDCIVGWTAITDCIAKHLKAQDKPLKTIAIDCYQGVFEDDILSAFGSKFSRAWFIHTNCAMLTEKELDAFFHPDITDDELFG